MMRFLVLFACGLPVWTAAQAQPQNSAIAQLKDEIARDGRAASVSPDLTMKYETTLQRAEGSRVSFRKTNASEVGVDTVIESVDLAMLSPEVVVRPWSDSTMFPAVAYSSNGDSVIDEETVSRDSFSGNITHVSHRLNTMTLLSDAKDAGGRLRAQLSAAITACHGKALSLSAKAGFIKSEKASAAYLVELEGNDPVGVKLKGQCKDLVSGLLTSPSTAGFLDASVMPLSKDSTRSVLGHVDAMNGLGGRVKKTYLCIFEKYGNSWVSKSPPSIF